MYVNEVLEAFVYGGVMVIVTSKREKPTLQDLFLLPLSIYSLRPRLWFLLPEGVRSLLPPSFRASLLFPLPQKPKPSCYTGSRYRRISRRARFFIFIPSPATVMYSLYAFSSFFLLFPPLFPPPFLSFSPYVPSHLAALFVG